MAIEDYSQSPPAAGPSSPPLSLASALSALRDDPQAFVLGRELSEVYLLLDNLAANPDASIAALTKQGPPEGLKVDWLERLCRITWPPQHLQPGQEDEIERAQQAALLLRAKDYLNRLSAPATGATIAFTLLVTEEGAQADGFFARLWRRVRKFWAKEGDQAAVRAPDSAAAKKHVTPSRSSLAREAYPELEPQARRFRRALARFGAMPFLLLAATCAISWYTAVGNAAAADYATARSKLEAAETKVGESLSAWTSLWLNEAQEALKAEQARQREVASNGGEAAPTEEVPVPADLSQYAEFDARFCENAAAHPNGTYPTMELMTACSSKVAAQADLEKARKGLDLWAGTWGGNADSAGWAINLLAGAVLPVLYGFLGAAAAIVRTLSRKIKASLLTPRDLQLSWQQLALGAVIGACISLFIVSPEKLASGEAALLGPVALSSSAISFIAGFGVDAVFQALEALISRIFNIAPAASGSEPRTPIAP